MDKQLSDEEKAEKADYLLVNNGNSMLLPKILELHNSFANN
jgi:hypothetical protein